jgi:hypothetical protein
VKFKKGDYITGYLIGRDDKEHKVILKIVDTNNNSWALEFECDCIVYDDVYPLDSNHHWTFQIDSGMYDRLHKMNKNEMDDLMVELL